MYGSAGLRRRADKEGTNVVRDDGLLELPACGRLAVDAHRAAVQLDRGIRTIPDGDPISIDRCPLAPHVVGKRIERARRRPDAAGTLVDVHVDDERVLQEAARDQGVALDGQSHSEEGDDFVGRDDLMFVA